MSMVSWAMSIFEKGLLCQHLSTGKRSGPSAASSEILKSVPFNLFRIILKYGLSWSLRK